MKKKRKNSTAPKPLPNSEPGWTPTQDWYLRLRTKYPYRFAMTGNAHLDEYRVYYGNEEANFVLGYEIERENQTLKAVPKGVRLYFHDNAGQRYWMDMKFHEGAYNSGERDLTAIQKYLKPCSPTALQRTMINPLKQRTLRQWRFMSMMR